MLEARELFVKSIEEKFVSNQYLNDLEHIWKKFSVEGKNSISENIGFLRDVTRFVFGVEIEDEEILNHWEKIFNIKKSLETHDIRVIAFDYFLNGKFILSPKIMEMEKFADFIEIMFQDHKTFAYNYHLLKVLITYEIEKIKRYGGSFSIIMMDLDNFKYYNDKYGHKFGDEILNDFSKIVLSYIRKSDILFRYGGDEFVVFCPETRRIGARVVAERIRESISEYFKSKNINISASIGIAVFPFDGESFEDIIEIADKMLYYSKKKGKNRVTDIFDFVEDNDRRKFPRIAVDKSSKIIIKVNNIYMEGNIVEISKGGILVKFNSSIKIEDEIVELHKLIVGDSEYVLDIFAKLARVEGTFIAIDFRENKTLETIIYLFEK